MDVLTFTLELLKAAGIVGATFAATYGALVRPLDKRITAAAIACDPKVVEDVQELRKKLEALQETVVKHHARGESIEDAVERAMDAQRRLEDRVARTVTDEEFATYVAANNSQLSSMIEKVGHVCGSIEAWARSR